MTRRFLVRFGPEVIGSTELEHLDAGMGIAHGRFHPLPAYRQIRGQVVRASEARHAGSSAEALPLEIQSEAGEILSAGFIVIDDLADDARDADPEITAQLKDREQVERLATSSRRRGMSPIDGSPESLSVVEAALSEYLKRPLFGDSDFVVRHRALPLYAGWTGTTYLTRAGAFWFRNCDYDPPRIENDLSVSAKIVALVVATERHPELVRLLPPRPAGAIDCGECGGSGQITVGTVSNFICGHCSALGWRCTEAQAEDDLYPTFDAALDRFRVFAGDHGFPTDFVFISAEHALLVRDRLFVAAAAFSSDAAARNAYERAVGCRLGVCIGALGELPDGRVGVYVYGPATENEAERLMYPKGLKMTIPERRAYVRVVGRLKMRLLQLRYGRRVAERTREYFR